MNRNQRRSRLALVLLGSGLIATVVVAPASAAITGGAFFVHAQNTDNQSIEAYAGKNTSGTPSNGGGSTGGGSTGGDTGGNSGGSTPGSGDGSAVTATYKGGPLAATVTEDMLKLSDANAKAEEEGRTGDIRTHQDGWQTIWHYEGGAMKLGIPATDDGSSLMLVIFSKSSKQPSVNESAGFYPSVYSYQYFRQDGNSYDIRDFRKTPADGVTVAYGKNGYGYYYESRYATIEGKLRVVTSSKQADGALTVERRTSLADFGPVANSRLPYNLRIDTKVRSTADILLPSTVDGYNQISFAQLPDGTSTLQYNYFAGTDSNGQQDTRLAQRKHGPTSIGFDADGQIKSMTYIPLNQEANGNSGSMPDRGSPYTAADYNAFTGQDWNGDYAKLSDFDLSLPFEATKP